MTAMHPGIWYDGHQITKVVIPRYNPATDQYDIMQEMRWAWYNDNGTMRRWARKVPAPGAAGLFGVSSPTDADPYFRYSVAGRDNSGTYQQSIVITIIRVSTGETVWNSGNGWWASDGPGESYHVTVSVQNILDNTIPSEFSSYQIQSDIVYSAVETYTDPRDQV